MKQVYILLHTWPDGEVAVHKVFADREMADAQCAAHNDLYVNTVRGCYGDGHTFEIEPHDVQGT